MAEQTREERKREKQQFWASHIESWKDSGLSQIDYCRQNDLSRHRFTYWKSKRTKELGPVTFMPVFQSPGHPCQARNQTIPIRLIISDKYRLEIGDGFSPHTLGQLLHTLERV